ncbi:MAG: cytochrome D1 domain-containing protein, partial [Caldimonas sp.]
MKRRDLLGALAVAPLLPGCAAPATSVTGGSGDLAVVVERSRGTLALVNTSRRTLLAEIDGLGDLSHASVVFSRDGATAYV